MRVSLRMQLAGGFAVVLAMAVLLGVVGVVGMRSMQADIDEIGVVRLPSVDTLLIISEQAQRIRGIMFALGNPELTAAQRQRFMDELTAARQRYSDAWTIYEPLPQTVEEAATWKEFVPAWNAWREENNKAVAIAKQINELESGRDGLVRSAAAIRDAALAIKGTFLSQVQEWKNVLLRGASKEMYDKYWSAFETNEAKVRASIEELVQQAQAAGIAVEEAKAILAEHTQLGARYRAAIAEFVPGDPASAWRVDASIRGVDRPLTAALDGLVQKLDALVDQAARLQRSLNAALLGPVAEAQGKALRLLDRLVQINRDVATASLANAQSTVRRFLVLTTGLLAAAIVLATAVTWWIIRGVLATVGGEPARIAALVGQVAEGDLTTEFVCAAGKCRGIMDAMGRMVAVLRRMLREISGAAGRLTDASAALASAAQDLSGNAAHTQTTAQHVQELSAAMEAGMAPVVAATHQAGQNISSVAAAAEEMSASVAEIARSMDQARATTQSASHKAEAIQRVVAQLGQAAQDIGKITETISAISEQTNLLALNATIEAARAGEAGKGFAVVASEIKELAKQTGGATEDIRTKIEGIQKVSAEVVAELAAMTQAVAEVSGMVDGVSTAMDEQAGVTAEIAGNVAKAAAAMDEVTRRMDETSRQVREVAGSMTEAQGVIAHMAEAVALVQGRATELAALAEELQSQVRQFRLEG